MLKTLIVDDEKLVRSEMHNLVNWADYQIEIVGEAENGRAALRFLEENESTDLMITDLSMPGLSGMEFLKAVRKKFPKVRIVVMTMHQDFDLLQQALRLGAVEYITKTQAEKESFGDTLHGLLKRLSSVPGEECCEMNEAVVCLSEVPFADDPSVRNLYDNLWLLPSESCLPQGDRRITLLVSEVFGMTYRVLTQRVKEHIERKLFYKVDSRYTVYRFCAADDIKFHMTDRDETALLMKGSEWITDDCLYFKILKKIPELCMTRDELMVFLYQPYLHCASFLQLSPADYFTQIEDLVWWYQWCEWLDGLRIQVAACLYPEDSASFAIQKAVAFINANYMKDMALQDMLRLTAMSKSRFSGLFKEYTGKTFGKYIKQLRIDYAKKLLAETEQSVLKIGEMVGYPDESYFRRIFLECSGYTPSQYRRHERIVKEKMD